ncbi:hypothetical protein E2P65_02050 [Candidatus Bathyarchaeota archaeon]|nr:hypothetical protein E2P65_02050 [Candidatus Bathyarchaeota archaeon]
MEQTPFRLKVKIGEMEVELGGDKQEVLSTLDDLKEIVDKVTIAFEGGPIPEISVAEPTVAEAAEALKYPKIPRTNQCSEAVVNLLSTEWGKTPRPIGELREAMEANAVFFPKTTLSGVLVWLVKKGQLRRWKDKKRGYLYVVNELEAE